jgi:hypothetical protein
MKYHNLPTIKQIEAYNSGRMSTGERKWMDSMIKRNEFVKESVEAAKTADMAAVGRISSHITSTVTSQYLVKAGFWSKYGGWISFSSIAIIIGLGAYFGPDLYNQYINETIVQVEEDDQQNTTNEVVLGTDDENTSTETVKKNSHTNSTIANMQLISVDPLIVDNNDPDGVTEEELIIAENTTEGTTTNEKVEEKKEVKESAPKEATLTVLSVKKVVIASKFDPDNKATINFPAYPGGDLALCDYFKSKLRPIQVPDADKYSKKATIVLEVSAKGKVTSSSIKGNIHPTHKATLQTAIDNLSKFDAGKSKVQYSVVVSF